MLLDQNKIFCGIGNWLADEILFQAQINPETTVSRLNELGIDSLLKSMHSVLKVAIEVDAQSHLFPKHWLFHYRWQKKQKLEDKEAFGT
jgi:formamidopyrimidine-DNA glycosylase